MYGEDGFESVKRKYDALLLDAGGTLLQLSKPVEETYARIGSKYGLFYVGSRCVGYFGLSLKKFRCTGFVWCILQVSL